MNAGAIPEFRGVLLEGAHEGYRLRADAGGPRSRLGQFQLLETTALNVRCTTRNKHCGASLRYREVAVKAAILWTQPDQRKFIRRHQVNANARQNDWLLTEISSLFGCSPDSSWRSCCRSRLMWGTRSAASLSLC